MEDIARAKAAVETMFRSLGAPRNARAVRGVDGVASGGIPTSVECRAVPARGPASPVSPTSPLSHQSNPVDLADMASPPSLDGTESASEDRFVLPPPLLDEAPPLLDCAVEAASVASSVAPSLAARTVATHATGYTHATHSSCRSAITCGTAASTASSGSSPSSLPPRGVNRRLAADLLRLKDPATPPGDAARIIGALVKASRSGGGRAAVIRGGSVPALIVAMGHHAGCRDVQERACAALQNLAVECEQRRKIALAGGILAVLTAMKSHPDDGGVQEQGCNALRNLVWDNPNNRAAIGAKGGVLVIADAVRRHRANGGVVHQALRALRSLAKDSAPNRLAICGALPSVAEAMAEHATRESLQVEGCAALRNLSVSEDSRATVAAAGGVDAIVGAMREHPKSGRVQSQACGALYNLSFHGGNLALMREGKSCKRALKHASRTFPDTCSKHADAVLDRMAVGSRNATATPPLKVVESPPRRKPPLLPTSPERAMASLRELGRSSAAISTLREVGRSASFRLPKLPSRDRKWGGEDDDYDCIALSQSSQGRAARPPRVPTKLPPRGSVGGAESRSASSSSRADEGSATTWSGEHPPPEAEAASLVILRHVQALREGVRALPEGDAVRTIDDLGRLAKTTDMSLRRRGSGGGTGGGGHACANGHRVAIAAAGGLTALISFAARRVGSAPIQAAAFRALSNLCQGDDDACASAAREGGIDAVAAGMITHWDDADVQGAGCVALRALTATEPAGAANRDLVRGAGGTEAAVAAMRAHPRDVRVQECALGALCHLTQRNRPNCDAAADAGCVPSILQALGAYPRNALVQERGTRTLCQLSEGSAGLAAMVREEEPEAALWDAAGRYPSECGEWCRRVLERL